MEEKEDLGSPIHGFNIGIDHRYEGTETHHDLQDIIHGWKHNWDGKKLHDEILHNAKHSPDGKYNLPGTKATVFYNSHNGSFTLKKTGDY